MATSRGPSGDARLLRSRALRVWFRQWLPPAPRGDRGSVLNAFPPLTNRAPRDDVRTAAAPTEEPLRV